VENALRVTPAGGLVIDAAAGRLTVSDAGPGIAAEDLPHAFERFHLRRKDGGASADGSGIGLAIVRELTEAMGGSVEAQSELGRGAAST
jgi:two-component system sensor histidine kinase BaeS